MNGKCRQIKLSVFEGSPNFNEKADIFTETFEGSY